MGGSPIAIDSRMVGKLHVGQRGIHKLHDILITYYYITCLDDRKLPLLVSGTS